MDIIAPPICVDCKRLHKPVYGKWGLFCDAFPEGIPDAIKTSRADHRQPFPGDRGIQFVPKSEAAAEDAAHIIAQAQQAQQQQDKEQPPNGRQPQ